MVYTLAIFALCLFALPLCFVVGALIVFTSGFPVLFLQKRMGKDGKIFVIYKFRTMQKGAEQMQSQLASLNESSGPTFKVANDPRFTRLGKFLSHTGLDELPQLFNVLRGEMDLIGPRPLPVNEAKKLASWMRKRHSVLSGIISPAILSGKYHKNFDAWMKSDVAYVKAKNISRDVNLLLRCIPFIARLVFRATFTL